MIASNPLPRVVVMSLWACHALGCSGSSAGVESAAPGSVASGGAGSAGVVSASAGAGGAGPGAGGAGAVAGRASAGATAIENAAGASGSAPAAAGAGAGGSLAANGGAGAAGGAAGGASAAGAVAPAAGGGGAPAAGGGAGAAAGAGAEDLSAVASMLQGLTLDVTCTADTPMMLERGATCQHPAGMQEMTQAVKLGGTAGTRYKLTLRVRGIWEPTLIEGGERPGEEPLTVGGKVPAGTSSSDPVNYQQYSIQVSDPAQVYWLNDYQYVAHDIHKEDYEMTLEASGGADVKVTMHDGNERQIANFTRDHFEGLAPHADAPSLGQLVRLDVVKIAAAP